MKNVIVTAALALSSTIGMAAVSTSQWNGTGTLYDHDRNVVGTYSVQVDVQPGSDADTAHTVVKVTEQDGTIFNQICDQKEGDNRWTKTCDDGGSGGGYLFDNGLGADYYRAADGKAYATTIVFDGANKMRMERTELDANGQALHFYSETYTKAAQ
jgi:hypothetical protein